MILDRAVITLEAARSVRVCAQLRKLHNMAHAAALRRVDKVALFFFDLRGRGYQQEEPIDSHQSAHECFRFREIALDDVDSRKARAGVPRSESFD